MVDECIKFSEEHSIKFNGPKTQFLISGISPIPNPTITLDTALIKIKSEMKHLGFKWGMKGKLVTLDRHKESSIAELWAITSSLTSCGIKWNHPNTAANIFKTLVIQKILYGIEIMDINKCFNSRISTQCRSSLKSLWGMSKFCRNDLNKYYNLSDMTHIIKSCKIKFLQQLMKNTTTRHYLITLLTLKDRSFSTLQDTFNLVQKENLDLVEILVGKNIKSNCLQTLESEKELLLKGLLDNWSVQSHSDLKNLLESNIPR